MRLTFVAWVVPLHSRRRSVENIQIVSKTRVYLTAWSFHWSPFVWCLVYNKSKPNLCTALTTHHTKKKSNYYITRTKHDCALAQCILTGLHRVLATNKQGSAFPIANQRQGQLQTPQTVSVATLSLRQILHFRWICVRGVKTDDISQKTGDCGHLTLTPTSFWYLTPGVHHKRAL